MKVPTHTAELSLEGQLNVAADGEQLSSARGLAALGQQLQGTASNIAGTADLAQAVNKQKKREDDIAWASKSYNQEVRFLNEWMANPENNAKESYPDDLLRFASERLQTFTDAPSDTASRILKTQYDSFVTSSHDHASQTAARTRLTNLVQSTSGQIDEALASYRAAIKIPNVDGGQTLLDQFSQINSTVEALFGNTMPSVAQKLKERMAIEGAYATMNSSPELARQLLDSSKSIDEHTRWTITNQIEQVEQSKNAEYLTTFDTYRRNVLASASEGINQSKIPIEEYRRYYPDALGSRKKAEDDALIDRFNKANDFMAKHSGKAGSYMLMALDDLRKNIAGNDADLNKDVYSLVAQRVIDNVRLQETDPTTWMVRSHPVIKGLFEKAVIRGQAATDAENKDAALNQDALQARSEYYDAVLTYQGSAPEGTSEVNKALYLNLPMHARHIMTRQQATDSVTSILTGSPSEILQRIEQAVSQYPGEKYQGYAFSDLVTLPQKGLDQEYQLAFLNRKEPWIKSYLGAIANKEVFGKVATEEKAKFEEALKANPTWLHFARALTGDSQRQAEMGGFYNGILTMALARNFQYGENYKTAVNKAANDLIFSNLGLTMVNGTSLIIPKERAGEKGPRTTEEVADIGRSLENLLLYVDAAKINRKDPEGRSHWPQLDNLTGNQGNKALWDDLQRNGFFQPSPDGQVLTLYYRSGNTPPFEVRDQEGKAIAIKLTDVPDFIATGFTHTVVRGSVYARPITVKYSHDELALRLKSGQMPTNWPIKLFPLSRDTKTVPGNEPSNLIKKK
jgi:hypothetical protein